MNFLKKLVQQTYDAIIIDDYIEPISKTDIFLIIQKHRRLRKRSIQGGKYDIENETINQQKLQIEDLNKNNFDVNSLFKEIGNEYQQQIINEKIQYLQGYLKLTKQHLTHHFPVYMNNINSSIKQVQQLVEIAQKVKPKIKQISFNLKRLQKQKLHNEKVTQMRIKSSNIKDLLSYLMQLPKINIMKISQLKSINIPDKIKQLKCYSSLQLFIKQRLDEANQKIVDDLKQILQKFQQKKYNQLIFRYYELDSINLDLDKLIGGICAQTLRKFQINSYDLCSYYVTFMANFHLICRWHHQFKIKNQFSTIQKKIFQIKTNIFNLRKKLWTIIQDHLQVIISQMIDLQKHQMFQLMCQSNRFIQIGQNFCSFQNSGKIGQQLYLKSIGMINNQFQKYITSFSQSLIMEQTNQWSRIPVENQYRYNNLELLIKSFIKKTQNPQYLQFVQNNFCYLINKQKKKSSSQQNWSFKKFSFQNQPLQAIRLKKMLNNYQQFQFDDQVVVSQSAFPILKAYEICTIQLFYLRLIPEKILNNIYFLTQYYIYYTYFTFTTLTNKNIIFNIGNNLEQKFEREKTKKKYPALFQFIIRFKNNHKDSIFLQKIKQSKQQKKILRSRVVSSQSIKFVLAYLEFILKKFKPVIKYIDEKWDKVQKQLKSYNQILIEVSQLIYTDCITRIANNFDTIMQPFTKILWNQDQLDLVAYRLRIQGFVKDFYQKIKGVNKGQIPLKIIDKIFKLFCVFIIDSIKQSYIKIKKINQNGRNLIINLLIQIQQQFSIFYNNQPQNYTTNLIKLIQISNKQNWQEIQAYIKNSVDQYEQHYKVYLYLVYYSKYAENLNKAKLQQKQFLIMQYIRNQQMQAQYGATV